MKYSGTEEDLIRQKYLTVPYREIATLLNRDARAIKKKVQAMGLVKKPKIELADNWQVLDQRLSRILGRLAGDGHISISPSQYVLGYNNSSYLRVQSFKQDLYDKFGIPASFFKEKRSDQYVSRAGNKQVALWLKNLFTETSHLKIGIPSIIMQGADEHKALFLRELFSDDGYVMFRKRLGRKGYFKSVSLSTSSPKLCADVSTLLKEFGIHYKHRYRPKYESIDVVISTNAGMLKFSEIIGFNPDATVCKRTSPHFGTPKSEVLKRVVRYIHSVKRSDKSINWVKITGKEILSGLSLGLNHRQIAEKYGVTRSAVSQRIKQLVVVSDVL